MSRPSPRELDLLGQVAFEICETAQAEGYTVERAISSNVAFRDGNGPTSSLQRAIVKAAARRGASEVGMSSDTTAGGGLDLVSIDADIQRRYRLKVATKSVDGDYDFVCGVGSSLLHAEVEGVLWREERWILGFNMTEDNVIGDIFIAEVVGYHGAGPVHLELGPVIPLNPASPPLGFTSSDEGLGEDEDKDVDEGDTGAA